MTKPPQDANSPPLPPVRKTRHETHPITLGELAEGGIDLFCWCDRCHHNAVLHLDRLLREFGRRQAIPALANHLRCSRCNGKAVSLRPAWPSLGQVTRHS